MARAIIADVVSPRERGSGASKQDRPALAGR